MKNKQADEWLRDLPVQAENIAFNPEEMILCAKCRRTNPPNRLNCLYCGVELEISDSQKNLLKPNFRKLESWEKGFNVILLPDASNLEEENLEKAAKLLKLEKDFLQKLFDEENPLPLARAESEKEAGIAKMRLGELGIETTIVSDELLAIDKPPSRLRGIEFFDDKLIIILFNQDEIVEAAPDELAVIVTGAVFERKIAATEKYNKKGDNKILDTTETATDEILIDIYSRVNSSGFRIYAKGFDFSSLEEEKGILAKDNIKKLEEKLRRFAPNAKFVNAYLRNRNLLANIWEVEQKSDSQGLQRKGIGKFSLESVTTVSNLSQFTKYSRLQWHLL
jgi:hypothetical protein